MQEPILVKSMYPCQDVPVVVLGKRCNQPCLYCSLYKKQFSKDRIIATGEENIIFALKNYKGAYFSAVTDCFLDENTEETHNIIEKTWKINPKFVPLVITKQNIPDKTIKLFSENKNKLIVQVSVPSLDQETTSLLEPGAVSIKERLATIKKLIENGINVIVVIMPWIDIYESLEDLEKLPQKLSEIGVKRVILGTVTLAEEQKIKLLSCKNKKIVENIKLLEDSYTLPYDNRVESYKKIINALAKYNIKAKICMFNNPDILTSDLPICTKLQHHCFKCK